MQKHTRYIAVIRHLLSMGYSIQCSEDVNYLLTDKKEKMAIIHPDVLELLVNEIDVVFSAHGKFTLITKANS